MEKRERNFKKIRSKKKIGRLLTVILSAALMVTSVLTVTPSVKGISVGTSENGILIEEWRFDMYWYQWGYFGSSPGIADLGSDVNIEGTEPDVDLEIVTGSDEMPGYWRCFDSQGNVEWTTYTQSDEARGDIAIIDINNDGYLEIAGGTTSGETVEVMDRFGSFVWTFPDPPHAGGFMWDGGPAVADVDNTVDGLELIIGNRPRHEVYALDGDNSDGIDEGYSWSGGWPWTGTEGTDWDILWIYLVPTSCQIYSTVALGDVDNDGTIEAVFGATDGNIYILNAVTGGLEWSYSTGGAIYGSAALADLDGDGYLEMVIGSSNGNVYALQWDGITGSVEWTFSTAGAVYSSAAIGDIDGDGDLETVIGSFDGKIYSLSASGSEEWNYATGGRVYSSPSLADRTAGRYAIEWAMFRNNPERTGYYGPAPSTGLDVYVGSEDRYLYLLNGNDGSMIDRFLTCSGGSTGYQGIHTSPSVADVDGDYKLEIFFYDWGTGSSHNGHTFWALENTESGYESVYIDIKPGSCPNPLNRKSKGVLPVAICGTDEFDVTTIDPDTIQLTREGVEGYVEPLRWSYEDVATPYTGGEGCGCHELNGDGYMDLSLKFSTLEVVDNLELVLVAGETIPLIVTGNLKEEYDGTAIEGQDCIWVLLSEDVGVTEIISPTSGIVQTFTPEVTVENFGTKKGKNVPVNMIIEKEGGIVEYDETVYINIDVGESMNVVFPDWTPDDWQVSGNVDIDYTVTACTQLATDEDSSNDCVSKDITLHYPYLHDVGVTEILSPTSGPSQTFTPEVTVENFGQFDEVDVPVNMQIATFAPPVTLLSEDFESGLPGTWTVVDGGTSTDTWTDTNPGGKVAQGGCAGMFMIADSDWAGSSGVVMYEELISPSFDCSAASQVLLDYSHYYWHLSSFGYVDVWDGSTWTNVKTYTATTTGPEVGLDISSIAAGKSDVKIRFVYDDVGVWAWYWMVDNVVVTGVGAGNVEYDVTVDIDIDSGETTVVTFPNWTPVAYGISGCIDYEVTACTQLDTDTNPANDCQTETITLCYFHDVGVTSITEWPGGSSGSIDICDLQFFFDLEAATGAPGNVGAEFDGTYFYSTRWASNLIHQYDTGGNLIKEFSIPGVSGLRDLAYDGNYFYGGAAGTTIYEMDFDNEILVNTIDTSSIGVTVRSIAYDEAEDAFWVNNWGNDITLVDRSGNTILDTIPNTISLYGSAYDGDSPGGPFLWIFSGISGGCQIEQYDLDTKTLTGVTHSVSGDLGVCIAGGLFFTTDFIPGTATIGGCAQGTLPTPDIMFVYEICETGGGGNVYPPGTYQVQCVIENYGIFTENNFNVHAEIWKLVSGLDDVLFWEDDFMVTTPLEVDGSAIINFNDVTFEDEDEGDYELIIATELLGDNNPANDRKTETITLDY